MLYLYSFCNSQCFSNIPSIWCFNRKIRRKEKNENIITENNPQEELVSNSIEDEIECESEISIENYNNILIDFPNNKQLGNNKQFSIELNIKTLDFHNLIFILKIQNIKYKREKSVYMFVILMKWYSNITKIKIHQKTY